MGLANRVVPKGVAHQRAEQPATRLARLPHQCMRSCGPSVGKVGADALDYEIASIARVMTKREGAGRFAAGSLPPACDGLDD